MIRLKTWCKIFVFNNLKSIMRVRFRCVGYHLKHLDSDLTLDSSSPSFCAELHFDNKMEKIERFYIFV